MYPLPVGSRPTRIVAGDNDDLWIAAPGTDSIERVEAATGAVTSCAIGSGSKNKPVDLALAPDGSIFFTQTTNRIGRLMPGGRVTRFPIVRPGRFIVSGPGDEFWFSTDTYSGEEGPNANGIASITPEGHATYGACVGECASPTGGLAMGPDGALWYGTETRFSMAAALRGCTRAGSRLRRHLPSVPAGAASEEGRARPRGERELGIACRRGVAGERCRGRLDLKASPAHGRQVRVGSVGFNLYSGEEAALKVRLTRRARGLLRAGPVTAQVGPGSRLVGKAAATVKIVPPPQKRSRATN